MSEQKNDDVDFLRRLRIEVLAMEAEEPFSPSSNYYWIIELTLTFASFGFL